MFACCRETARRVPMNYILLFSYTFCMSFYLLILCSEYSTKAVFTALVLTVAATLGLTIYAFTTTHDFTFCSGILFAFFTVLISTIKCSFKKIYCHFTTKYYQVQLKRA